METMFPTAALFVLPEEPEAEPLGLDDGELVVEEPVDDGGGDVELVLVLLQPVVPALTVNSSDCARLPLESIRVSSRDVSAETLISQVKVVPVRSGNTKRGVPSGALPGIISKVNGGVAGP